jgi:hypothetical protein
LVKTLTGTSTEQYGSKSQILQKKFNFVENSLRGGAGTQGFTLVNGKTKR